jgi:hypothetical protein
MIDKDFNIVLNAELGKKFLADFNSGINTSIVPDLASLIDHNSLQELNAELYYITIFYINRENK